MSSEVSFTLASRKSPLAVCQAEWVRRRLSDALGLCGSEIDARFPIETFVTEGDKRLSGSLAEIGGKGLFTKEVERALLDGSADIAVHSMKDMPAVTPEGLEIAAIPVRDDPRDAFISPIAARPADLPENARVGTSSVRRTAQLLNARPDLEIVPFRGNVGTRLGKLEGGEVDATLLAEAGLRRLQMDDVKRTVLDPEEMLPAAGQGILCVQMRADDPRTDLVAGALGCRESALASAVERAFLTRLDGSCQTPIAGFARVSGAAIEFTAQLLSLDGAQNLRITDRYGCGADPGGQLGEAAQFGREMADRIFEAAPKTIQDLVRRV